jgi:hypothetical protein
MIKSKVMRWAGHVMHVEYWWESRNEGAHWEDQGVGVWTILKRILREIGWDGID